MPGLDDTCRIVENLYRQVIFKEDIFDDGCSCGICYFCETSIVLSDRIRKNLRSVLCDLIVLKMMRDEFQHGD